MTVTAAERAPALAALVLVTGVGPLAIDTYVAALPQVQRSLGTTASAAQLTITAFIIGMAVGQLTFGPISDGLGRRRMLLAGTAAFAVMSALCAVAPNGMTLVGARFLQGLVAGAGIAIGRAVVSDRYEGAAAAARFGTLMGITYLGPVLAPALGGLILVAGDWRSIFAFLTLLGVAQLVSVYVGIPESLPPSARHGNGLGAALRRMRDLGAQPDFRAPVLVQCLATAGFFVYIGGSSFVLQDQLGFSRGEYTLCFATNAAAMAVFGAVFARVVRRTGAPRLRTTGLLISTSAVAVLAGYAFVSRPGTAATAPTWALLALTVAGMGLCIPGTTAIAQQAGRRFGGAASALQGGLTFVVGAAATPLTGLTGHQTVAVMAGLMALFYLLAVGALVITRSAAQVPRS